MSNALYVLSVSVIFLNTLPSTGVDTSSTPVSYRPSTMRLPSGV